MKKLLKYLDNYKKECILAPLFKMLEALFELTVPLVIARMIDMGIRKNSPADIDRKIIEINKRRFMIVSQNDYRK